MTAELQHTLAKSAGFSGTSLHTGEKVTLKLQPAPVDHGIKFKRKDLADEPTIDANIANLKTVERATTIGEGAVRVHTVEHVLSALSAMGVDNAIVEMTANEPPIGDGSATPYVEMIKKAGTAAQDAPRRFFDVREPIHVESKSGSLLGSCRMTSFASPAPKQDQTIALPNFSQPKFHQHSTNTKLRRRALLFSTRKSRL